jgi:D-lactate dehydrogenase (cytochrome)
VPEPVTDPEVLEAYLEDASGRPPGRAAGLLRPGHESEIASFLRGTLGKGITILPQAARSSLTTGATPSGDVVVSVEAMAEVGAPSVVAGGGSVRVGPGVRLRDLQREVARRGLYYPPVPTYQEAMIAGTIATNAGGAATFKYGVTRDWVHGLRVALFNGDVLQIDRGQCVARPGHAFDVVLSDGGELRVPVPDYTLPPLKKISAGYHAADPLDLVDLFVGAEGTLGVITEATLDLAPLPASQLTGLAFQADTQRAIALGSALRAAAEDARLRGDRGAPDVRAIELMDERALDLLRRHGESRRLRVEIPPEARASLLFEVELPEAMTGDAAQDVLERFLEGQTLPEDRPLSRLFEILRDHDALDGLELAFPEDEARAGSLREFREAVPLRVNEILAERRRTVPGVRKVGGDLIVPVSQVAEIVEVYERGFTSRGLEFAIWGHLSDGNLHPNALPRNAGETEQGLAALLEFADEVTRRGGCPLSEHGVGRNPVKQEMLRRFHGPRAMAAMQAVKRALDPEMRFAPGVLFPRESSGR